MPKIAIRSLPPLVVMAILAAAFILSPGQNVKTVFSCYGYGYSCGAPTVTALFPYAGPITGGTTVNVTGTNFNNNAGSTVPTVRFGGVAAPIVLFKSDTLLTVASPAHAAGVVDVTVTNAGGTSAITGPDRYRYVSASYCAIFDISRAPTTWTQNVTSSFALNAFNCGTKAWPFATYYRVNSNVHFTTRLGSGFNTQAFWKGQNYHNLGHNIAPNRGVLIRITLTPRFHGNVYLEAEMIKLHQFWFGRYVLRPPQFHAVIVVVNP
jgi:IPT/TIG domain